MRHAISACALTFLLINSAIGAEKPAETPKRKVDFEFYETKQDGGTVLAVTKDSIMIVDRRKPPVSYPFHDRLASGTVHKKVREGNSHLVADLKVGDLIGLGLITENKQKFCVDLCICERPGGEIPPTQVLDKERPWYKYQNAQLAFRDKGIPIPEQVIPKLNVPDALPKETKDPPKK